MPRKKETRKDAIKTKAHLIGVILRPLYKYNYCIKNFFSNVTVAYSEVATAPKCSRSLHSVTCLE